MIQKKNKRKPQTHNLGSGDWLSALTVMGRILIFVPAGVSLVVLLYSVLSKNGGIDLEASPADAYLFGLIFLCGVVTMVYVAIKRFQQGLAGNVEAKQDQESASQGETK